MFTHRVHLINAPGRQVFLLWAIAGVFRSSKLKLGDQVLNLYEGPRIECVFRVDSSRLSTKHAERHKNRVGVCADHRVGARVPAAAARGVGLAVGHRNRLGGTSDIASPSPVTNVQILLGEPHQNV